MMILGDSNMKPLTKRLQITLTTPEFTTLLDWEDIVLSCNELIIRDKNKTKKKITSMT